MKENILITGGSGLVGQALTRHLLSHGYNVAHLNRKKGYNTTVPSYIWDIKNKFIEPGALTFPDYVIHLAGSGIFDKPWTEAYKKEIIDSRVKTAEFLLDEFSKSNHELKGFISASGISIYGKDTKEVLVEENSTPGDDYLATVVKLWEKAADNFADKGIRTVKIRIGIVLTSIGGALEKMAHPIKLGVGAPLGKGEQFVSWIHIDDLCRIFKFAIENKNLAGVFNATAPFPCNNKIFTKTLAQVLGKSIWLPSVPAFVLKTILGDEKSALVLGGNKVSSKKLEGLGYIFKYPSLISSLENLLK